MARRHGQLVGEPSTEAVAHGGDEAGDLRQALQVVEGGCEVCGSDRGVYFGEPLREPEGRGETPLVVR